MRADSGGQGPSAQRDGLADEIAALRRRRRHTAADVLLDDCLSLLDRLLDRWSATDVSGGLSAARGRDPRIDPATILDGESPEIMRLKQDIRCVAQDPYVSVLIRGETGTGKERVARAVHDASPRAAGPFVIVNCAGLAPALAEDELFGHVRGAFTGAIGDRPSPFERAHGGTVFLDEIGELTLDAQMKLLRALQERTVRRLGGAHDVSFDARVVAATNVDLAEAQRRGRFRQDLYFRLQVFELLVPPLRGSGEGDLQRLVEAILASLSARRNRPAPRLGRDAWEVFAQHSWPGNVRELQNVLERMVVAAGDATVLSRAHLPHDLRDSKRSARRDAAGAATVARRGLVALPSAAEARAALRQNRGQFGKTADDLGISRHQLYRLLKRHGAVEPDAVA